MSAVEARDYGIIDAIVGQTDKTQAADRAEAALAVSGLSPAAANGKS